MIASDVAKTISTVPHFRRSTKLGTSKQTRTPKLLLVVTWGTVKGSSAFLFYCWELNNTFRFKSGQPCWHLAIDGRHPTPCDVFIVQLIRQLSEAAPAIIRPHAVIVAVPAVFKWRHAANSPRFLRRTTSLARTAVHPPADCVCVYVRARERARGASSTPAVAQFKNRYNFNADGYSIFIISWYIAYDNLSQCFGAQLGIKRNYMVPSPSHTLPQPSPNAAFWRSAVARVKAIYIYTGV